MAPADEAFAPTVYKNCDAVRGAGAAALYAGKPGYSFKRDRDRDRDRDACE
nr:excalibur calcium-binding domain-containing protein [Prescottella equi]